MIRLSPLQLSRDVLGEEREQLRPDVVATSEHDERHHLANSLDDLAISLLNHKDILHLQLDEVDRRHLQSSEVLVGHRLQGEPGDLPYARIALLEGDQDAQVDAELVDVEHLQFLQFHVYLLLNIIVWRETLLYQRVELLKLALLGLELHDRHRHWHHRETALAMGCWLTHCEGKMKKRVRHHLEIEFTDNQNVNGMASAKSDPRYACNILPYLRYWCCYCICCIYYIYRYYNYCYYYVIWYCY